jgi:predicted nucleic acid-binding protein
MDNHQTWDYQQAVFLDDSALTAFMNPEDPRYTKARSLFLDLHDLDRNFVTTNSIVFEVHVWLRNHYSYQQAEFFLNVMDKAVSKGKLAIIPGGSEFELESRQLLIERPELQFSLREALTTVVMSYHQIKRIFTFNPNFNMLNNLNMNIKVIPSTW